MVHSTEVKSTLKTNVIPFLKHTLPSQYLFYISVYTTFNQPSQVCLQGLF